MVALELTPDGKVYVADQIMPPVHPAALMFPMIEDSRLAALAKNISRVGQKAAIVMTPTGEILEGRGRWLACREAGRVPVVRTEESDPWIYIIRAHRAYMNSLNTQHRAMIVGRVPKWGMPRRSKNTHRYEDPPTLEAIAEAAGIQRHAVGRAQTIFTDGIAALHQLVIEERVALNTAKNASQLDVSSQELFVKRVLDGEDPRRILPGSGNPEERRRTRSAAPEGEYIPVRGRNRYVRQQAVRALIDALYGAKLVEEAAEGLDPTITPEEAGQLMRELTRDHAGYRRVVALLKERKDSQ